MQHKNRFSGRYAPLTSQKINGDEKILGCGFRASKSAGVVWNSQSDISDWYFKEKEHHRGL